MCIQKLALANGFRRCRNRCQGNLSFLSWRVKMIRWIWKADVGNGMICHSMWTALTLRFGLLLMLILGGGVPLQVFKGKNSANHFWNLWCFKLRRVLDVSNCFYLHFLFISIPSCGYIFNRYLKTHCLLIPCKKLDPTLQEYFPTI